MLNEWSLLPSDLQAEALSEISGLFSARVPREMMVGFGHGDGSGGANATEGNEIFAADADSAGRLQALLITAARQPERSWPAAWASLAVSRDDHAAALAGLLSAELALQASGSLPEGSDLAPHFIAELARAKAVSTEAVEEALCASGPGLEASIAKNESAWHLHAYTLLHLFPRTGSTSWGLQLPGWNWSSWWAMLERVLSTTEHLRSFDIVVMVLQQMQEKSGKAAKHLQVFIDSGRANTLRAALCNWSDMDHQSIAETLAAYGVEL